jgi:hypothetical protein
LLPYPFPTTATRLIILIVALIILWIVVSIPVYFSAKLVTEGRAHFGEALGATLLGAIVYYIVLIVVTFFLSAIMGYTAAVIGFVLAILAWLAVYKGEFQTGWLRALGIVVVAWAILFIINGVLLAFFGVTVPKFYPF